MTNIEAAGIINMVCGRTLHTEPIMEAKDMAISALLNEKKPADDGSRHLSPKEAKTLYQYGFPVRNGDGRILHAGRDDEIPLTETAWTYRDPQPEFRTDGSHAAIHFMFSDGSNPYFRRGDPAECLKDVKRFSKRFRIRWQGMSGSVVFYYLEEKP